ncbi:shikimate dehydrogenase [Robiginitalea sp. SC105]|uniref:shikimate dehydrogenase family protein n=1 Tax=Robiginitalea sp. SC105 TaxID=2762332 RepID=UPI001639A364|nr:shikimate dehydrogenase [Robiginitalea sp. SC105]MBC2839197.1 shikimate dehydrogenase [Robiginitalea sp. SC105]
MHRYGLIGRNISYSFSRGFFREKFQKLGLDDHSYENFDLDAIGDFPGLLRENPDLRGLNVTIPYKQAVMPYLGRIDPEAARIGAVNTICFRDGTTSGHNTDVTGFRESLRPLLRSGDHSALILGTGGASRAVAYALDQLGIGYRYVSRNPSGERLGYHQLDASILAGVQVIVNCTPLGTHPEIEKHPDLPYDALGPAHLLYDLIYNPERTEFLSRGLSRGTRIKNGLEMLQIQAEHAWKLWTATGASGQP